MNFFRMFRFPPAASDVSSDENQPNMVPILIVGVRAVNGDQDNNEPSQPPTNDGDMFNMFDSSNDADDDMFTPFSDAPWDHPRSSWQRPNTDTPAESPTSPETLHEQSPDQPNEQQSRQSWIVYVFGGTYPENHPILLAPSLFSDEPSYEDLITLETFMGQVKPPVATAEEVERAGGLCKVRDTNGSVTHLEAVNDTNEVHSVEGRCQVCLSEYGVGQECRKLMTCQHTFHRECIDQWLTTGRNSCPLCRAEAVAKD